MNPSRVLFAMHQSVRLRNKVLQLHRPTTNSFTDDFVQFGHGTYRCFRNVSGKAHDIGPQKRFLTIQYQAQIAVSRWSTLSPSIRSYSFSTHRRQLSNPISEVSFDSSKVQPKWSKERLATTTRPDQMKEVVTDIALRLEYQWKLLEDLLQIVSGWKDPQYSQLLENIQKNLSNLQILHRDTETKARQFVQLLDHSESSPLSKLLQRQLGQACQEIYSRHALTIENMADVVIDFRRVVRLSSSNEMQYNPTQWKSFEDAVHRFLASRLLTQLLCDHVVDCMLKEKPHGAISVNAKVEDMVQAAVSEVRHLVEASFYILPEDNGEDDDDMAEPLEPPQVIIQSSSTEQITIALVRPWLQYSLVELLKNSLSFTMERDRRDANSKSFYPVYIDIDEVDDNCVRIEIHDQGGGLKTDQADGSMDDPDSVDDLFAFAQTQEKWDRVNDQQTYAQVRSPVRGLGVGLALSRLHIQAFGGDLQLRNRPETADNERRLHRGVTAAIIISKDYEKKEAILLNKT